MNNNNICFYFLILLTLAEILIVQGVHIAPTRVKRGIFGTVFSTVYKTIEEKHYVPASCVHVAPNLPDCRNVRFMNYPSFDSNAFKFFNIGNELSPTSGEKENKNSATTDVTRRVDNGGSTTVYMQGWGEYLGFYRPTVTVTELKITPTTVLDPRIMVTYDIRGCKPHDLPYNLEKCVEDNSLELAEILPTSTVRADIKATKLPEKLTIASREVHGTEIEGDHEPFYSATKDLS